jgi:hypothetical protein
MKNLEICQEILFGRLLSEIAPNPPLIRGAGRISKRAVVQGKNLAAGFAALPAVVTVW